MPLKPPAPHFQALARRRARGESPRPRRKQAFDGQALISICSYNPVVEVKEEDYDAGVTKVLRHLSDYQGLVDRNREFAARNADWTNRIRLIKAEISSVVDCSLC